MASLALRLLLAAILPVGALALLFSQSDFATGALDPAATAARAIVPDFTPVGSIDPSAFETAAVEAPKTILVPSPRLMAPAGPDQTGFLRFPFAEPSSLCSAIRLGEAPAAWDKSVAVPGVYECFSDESVASDKPPIVVVPEAAAFGDAEGELSEEEAAAYDLPAEEFIQEAPPRRSLFVIARGPEAETVRTVRLKLTGESRAEAKVAAEQAAAMLGRLYEAFGWALPAEAPRSLAALDPFEMEDSGTRISLTREYGDRYHYNLVLTFPDARLAAKKGGETVSQFVVGPDDPKLPGKAQASADPKVETPRT